MKANFTTCVPFPSFIPRQLAINILHNHAEVITANPLVIEHRPRTPPSQASDDEVQSTWYDIVERIQYLPGLGKMGSGKIIFPACFHDLPWGLQTHIYAPMGVDMKVAYRVAGEQPGVEPKEPRELGLAELGAPADGLYLRADVEFKASLAFASFVRSQTKTALGIMVDRVIKKAERVDASVLQGMIERDRLSRRDTVLIPGGRQVQRTSQDEVKVGGSPYLGLQQPRIRASSTSALEQDAGISGPQQPASGAASSYLGLSVQHHRSRSASCVPTLAQQHPALRTQQSCAAMERSARPEYIIPPYNPADYAQPWSASTYAKLADVRPKITVMEVAPGGLDAGRPYDRFWSTHSPYGR